MYTNIKTDITTKKSKIYTLKTRFRKGNKTFKLTDTRS